MVTPANRLDFDQTSDRTGFLVIGPTRIPIVSDVPLDAAQALMICKILQAYNGTDRPNTMERLRKKWGPDIVPNQSGGASPPDSNPNTNQDDRSG